MDINNVTLTGRLTKDPELRKTTTGTSVVAVTVACNRMRAKDGTQSADFINCVVWNQPAEYLARYGRKGARVGLSGRIQTRSYEGNNGTVYVTEVRADSVMLFDYPDEREPEPEAEPEVEPERSSWQQNKAQYSMDINTDELPFY